MENRKILLSLQTIGRVELQTWWRGQKDPENWKLHTKTGWYSTRKNAKCYTKPERKKLRYQMGNNWLGGQYRRSSQGYKALLSAYKSAMSSLVERPNTKINRRKDKQHLLFYSEHKVLLWPVLGSPLLSPLQCYSLAVLLLLQASWYFHQGMQNEPH